MRAHLILILLRRVRLSRCADGDDHDCRDYCDTERNQTHAKNLHYYGIGWKSAHVLSSSPTTPALVTTL